MKIIYTQCSDLPYYNFVKALTTSDYTWLNEPRHLTDDASKEHHEAWNDIFQEYMSLTKNTQQVAVMELLKEITVINLRLDQIYQILNFMQNDFDPELVDILHSYGFRYAYDPNSEQYDKDLAMTFNAAKSMIINKEIAESELDKLKEDDGNGESTEQDYLALVIALSKFMGFRIDWKKISVSEYVEILNTFNKHLENGKRTEY